MKLDMFVKDEIQRRKLEMYVGEVEFQEIIDLAIEDGFRVKHAIEYVLRHATTNRSFVLLEAA